MKQLIIILLTIFTGSINACAQLYWQQHVNYTIDVTLDDADRSLDGFIKMEYRNNSPDTLRFIWIHCWPNAYKNDRTAFSEQLLGNGRTDFYFSDRQQRGYINHLDFRADGQEAKMDDHPQYIDIIKVILPSPLAPCSQVTLTTPFHVKLPFNFSRGGYEGHSYQLTQWYPKPAVYDSRGWHPIPYLDQGEFYSEFGDFDVRITVPQSFTIAATGELQDAPTLQELAPAQTTFASPPPTKTPSTHPNKTPSKTPTNTQHKPLPSTPHTKLTQPDTTLKTAPTVAQAGGMPPGRGAIDRPGTSADQTSAQSTPHRPDTAATSAVADMPIGQSNSSNTSTSTKTLHYKQTQIHDFAWFASKNFRVTRDTLQLKTGRIIEIYAYYTPAAGPNWKKAAGFIKDAVKFRDSLIGEYPYNVVTAVQTKMGSTGGMEYPTITAINANGSAKDLDATIEHEVGHNWFYGILGTNERRYPWMDEGINTYYDNRYLAQKYPAHKENWLQKKIPTDMDRLSLDIEAVTKRDQPISTASEDFSETNYYLTAYSKTGLWMRLLQDSIGAPLFDSCMREYYRRWQFKHPYPEDFRAVIADIARHRGDTLFSLLDSKGTLLPVPKHRPLKPTFLFNFRHADSVRYLNILPAAAYNLYDRFMIGLLVNNYNLPPSHLQFYAAPLYATGSHQLNGAGGLNYSWYPNRSFQKIRLGVDGSRMSTIDGIDSNGKKITGGYYKIVPSLRLEFPRSSERSTQQAALEWKTWLIGERLLDNYVQRSTDSLYYPTAGRYEFRYLNQLSFDIRDDRVLYPYKARLQVQQAASFYRIDLTGNYFFNYEKGGGLNVRLFGAKFGYLGSRYAGEDLSRFEPKLTAVRGDEDYTYSDYFIGRNEFTGAASQQIMLRDGDLKLRTDLFQGLQGRSDNWVASMNLVSTLPRQIVPEWVPLKVFLDIGTYSGAWAALPATSHFLYVGGLELSLFHDVFQFYAPIAYSSSFSDQLKTVPDQNSFWKRLSFSIELQNIDFRKLLGNIPL
jgi:hypothetical protein